MQPCVMVYWQVGCVHGLECSVIKRNKQSLQKTSTGLCMCILLGVGENSHWTLWMELEGIAE